MKPLKESEKEDERNKHWKELYGNSLFLDNERNSGNFTFDHVFDSDK